MATPSLHGANGTRTAFNTSASAWVAGNCQLARAITSLARGASDECDLAVALPLTAGSSQNVIGSFEARFFSTAAKLIGRVGLPVGRERSEDFGGSGGVDVVFLGDGRGCGGGFAKVPIQAQRITVLRITVHGRHSTRSCPYRECRVGHRRRSGTPTRLPSGRGCAPADRGARIGPARGIPRATLRPAPRRC